MNAKRLPEKDPGETVPLSWDFTDEVGTNAITGTPTVVVSVDASLFRGKDANPSALLSGAAVVVGKTVVQNITGGLDGVDYKVKCEAVVNSTPPALLFKSSVLPVRAQ